MSSPANRRPRGGQPRRKPVARSNSSFLGAIKGIVAPLTSWWSGGDDFEDAKDPMGKRRRTGAPAGAPSPSSEDGPAPAKRMRVDSPEPPGGTQNEGYLEPPRASFAQQHPTQPHHTSRRHNQSSLFPNTLADINNRTLSRDPYSPTRISRTMSLDPPQPRFVSGSRPLVHDASMRGMPLIEPLDRDSSMEPVSGARYFPSFSTPHRDRGSIPPVASRPIFPVLPTANQNRDVSMPPSIESLKANPTFVQAPEGVRTSPRKLSGQSSSSTTLGSLIDSRRSTLSPVRSHSSTSSLFGPPQQQPAQLSQNAPTSTYERVTKELEKYKTELLPTRVRERGGTATQFRDSASDPFNRKRKKLVLMKDDDALFEEHANRLGVANKKKKKPAEPRPAKPYEGKEKRKVRRLNRPSGDKPVEEEARTISQPGPSQISRDASMSSVTSAQEVPLPPPQKVAFSPKPQPTVPAAGSSLRVGRTLNFRNHAAAARPAKSSSSRFSAAFDDEEDAEEAKKKEFEMLEEAAKKAPVFQISAGFSFAKDMQPLQFDTGKAKEPPVPALPFSLSKPSTPAGGNIEQHQVPVVAERLRVGEPAAEPVKPVEPAAEGAPSAVSDFFAGSKVLGKQPEVEPAPLPVSLFSAQKAETAPTTRLGQATATPHSLFAPSPSVSATSVKDADNPMWEGEGAQPAEELKPAPSPLTFRPSSATKQEKPTATSTSAPAPAPSLFSFNKPAGEESSGNSAPKPSPFSFEGPSAGEKPAEPSKSLLFGESSVASDAPKPSGSSLFTFGQPAVAKTSELTEAPKFSLASSDSSKSLFGGSSQATSQTTSSPFTTTPLAEVKAPEPPKPLFTSAFSFGQTPAATEAKAPEASTSSSSLFGSGQSAAPAAAEPPKAPAFTFGVSSAPPAASSSATPTPFTFGASASNSSDVSSKPFSFSGFGSTSTTRAVTPPRNDDQDSRMEESPTREVKPSNRSAESRPTLGFSFSSSSASNPFAAASGATTPIAAPTTSPFAFGNPTPSASPNSFATASLPQENKPSFGGFAQSQSSTGFSFGAPKPAEQSAEPPRPSTTGSFSFSSPSSATGSNPFQFGPSSSSTSVFGQTGGSAPSSPAPPSQPFSFGGAPSGGSSNAFNFGGSSQPSSPALAPGQIAQSNSFGGFGSQSQVPSSTTFGGPTSAPPTGGGSLFTIGAAPTNQPRQIKKLPNRRGKR